MYLSKHKLAILAIVLNTLIWSAASPIFKWSLDSTPPFTIAFFRFAIATLILLPFVKHKLAIRFEDFYKLFTLAVIGITIHNSFYFLGLTLAPSINVPIISSMTPIFLIIGGILFLREKPKPKVLLGTIISLIGTMIIVFRPNDGTVVGSIMGNFYFVLSTLMFVWYTLLIKYYKLRYSYATIIFWTFFIGTIALLPMFILEVQTTNSLATLNLKGSIGIIYGAIFSSTLGYGLYNYAAKYIRANEIGIFSYLEPVATALVAIPLLHEEITFLYLLGGIIVFLGIFIAEAKLHYHPFHQLKRFNDPPLDSGP